ncbi:MAG: TlpA family protein disulfide reductase [Acidobacteria bacterium]|nr:TlpA family protein disulfide reductase [Acidobacteriota bacterium]
MAIAVLSVSLLVAVGASGQVTLQPGSAAPEFVLLALDGTEFKSSQLKGNVVLLDLWATWCEPCIAELPALNRLFEKYSGRGLKVIGVAVESGWATDIKPHVAKHRIKYPVLVGDEKIVEKYQLIGFPTTYLIGRDGRIVKKYIGTPDGTEAQKESDMEREIQRLLNER